MTFGIRDFLVQGEGTVYVLTPQTKAAKQWVRDRIEDGVWYGRGVAVEHRYIDPIVDGIRESGLTVRVCR